MIKSDRSLMSVAFLYSFRIILLIISEIIGTFSLITMQLIKHGNNRYKMLKYVYLCGNI